MLRQFLIPKSLTYLNDLNLNLVIKNKTYLILCVLDKISAFAFGVNL